MDTHGCHVLSVTVGEDGVVMKGHVFHCLFDGDSASCGLCGGLVDLEELVVQFVEVFVLVCTVLRDHRRDFWDDY